MTQNNYFENRHCQRTDIFFCDVDLKIAAAKNGFAFPNFNQKRNLRVKDVLGFALGCLTLRFTRLGVGRRSPSGSEPTSGCRKPQLTG